MASSSRELPQPSDDPNLIETFAGYRAALRLMTPMQLVAHSTELSARLEEQSRSTLASLISGTLSDSLQNIDRLQVRSTPAGPRSSERRDRGESHSRPSTPQPSALDQLARSKRLAPRIAAKLVLHEARRHRDG